MVRNVRTCRSSACRAAAAHGFPRQGAPSYTPSLLILLFLPPHLRASPVAAAMQAGQLLLLDPAGAGMQLWGAPSAGASS